MFRPLQVAILGILVVASLTATAQNTTPKLKPIELIVPMPAGGGTDIVARIIADDVTRKGTPVVVINKPGAERSIGANYVAVAPTDGYTLLLGGLTDAVMLPLFQYPNLKFYRDLTPVSFIASQPAMISVAPSFPANNLTELLALIKSDPKKYSIGSFGRLSTVDAYILYRSTGETPNIVSYKGDPQMLTDIIGGQPLIGINSIAGSRELAIAGKIKYIATSADQRLKDFPTVETTLENKISLGQFWHGIYAPSGTDPVVVKKLHDTFNRSIQDPAVQAELSRVGYKVNVMSQKQFANFYQSEFERYSPVVHRVKKDLEK
jgi:tripartite-type tricarboxylate transporter receptor subunit TctC